MAELLLELFSEEIPARMQTRAAEDLERLIGDKLKEAGLTFDTVRSFATPRRLRMKSTAAPQSRAAVSVRTIGALRSAGWSISGGRVDLP